MIFLAYISHFCFSKINIYYCDGKGKKGYFFFQISLNEALSADGIMQHEIGPFLFIKYCNVLVFMSVRFSIFCLTL